MTAVSPERLAEVFVEVADTLVDHFDLVTFLELVTRRTVELVDSPAAVLLLADSEGHLQVMAASAEEAHLLSLFEERDSEGPSHDAFRSGRAVVNADLTVEGQRWPSFAPRAVHAGYRSVHAFPLRLRDTALGALNVFGEGVGALHPDDMRIVQALADVATIGLLQERSINRGEVLAEQLQRALRSRVVIEQAKGAAAQVFDVSVGEAFELIRAYARRHNERLADVAQAVLADPGKMSELAPS